MRAARTSNPRCRPGGWELHTHLTPKHTKANSMLPFPTTEQVGGRARNGSPRHQHPSSIPKETLSCHCALTPLDSLGIPLGRLSALGPEADHSKAGRPSSKTTEAREECHSLSRELGGGWGACRACPSVQSGTLAFLLPKPSSTLVPARGPANTLGKPTRGKQQKIILLS